MIMKKRFLLGGGLIVVGLAIAYLVLFSDRPLLKNVQNDVNSLAGEDLVSQPAENNLTSEKEKPMTVNDTQPEPSFPKYSGEPINYIGNDKIIADFPTEALAKQKKYLALLSDSLNVHPYNFDEWMQVGIHKKFFNNYNGAKDAWEYAKILQPRNPLPYLNLANLYAYYLRDLNKAEENYLAAINNDLNNIYGSYYVLANFYRDFGVKDKALEYYQKTLQFNPFDEAVKTEIERLQLTSF